jgi:ComF family protein
LRLYKSLHRFLHINRLSVFLCQCKICGNFLVFDEEILICIECLKKIEFKDAPTCKRCGLIVENRHRLCGECIVDPPKYRKHVSYSIYDGVLKDVILLFKYGEIKRLKHLIAGYYIEVIEKKIAGEFDYLIPVPADKKRKREFCPIREIAKILSRILHIGILTGNLVKTGTTEPQAGLSRSKRLKNLDGVFDLKNPSVIADKKILLIDDVYTTGTTIKQCTKVLVKAKADVVAVTLARSI